MKKIKYVRFLLYIIQQTQLKKNALKMLQLHSIDPVKV